MTLSNSSDPDITPPGSLPAITLGELSPRIQAAVRQANWTELTPAQSRAIPYLLTGRDVMIQARTGSGKTGAFLLSEMSSGVTGEILHVDAGYNAMGSPGRLLERIKAGK